MAVRNLKTEIEGLTALANIDYVAVSCPRHSGETWLVDLVWFVANMGRIDWDDSYDPINSNLKVVLKDGSWLECDNGGFVRRSVPAKPTIASPLDIAVLLGRGHACPIHSLFIDRVNVARASQANRYNVWLESGGDIVVEGREFLADYKYQAEHRDLLQ